MNSRQERFSAFWKLREAVPLPTQKVRFRAACWPVHSAWRTLSVRTAEDPCTSALNRSKILIKRFRNRPIPSTCVLTGFHLRGSIAGTDTIRTWWLFGDCLYLLDRAFLDGWLYAHFGAKFIFSYTIFLRLGMSVARARLRVRSDRKQ